MRVLKRRGAFTGFSWGNHFEDPGVDGRTILSLIFRKWDVGLWLRIGRVSGHL